MTADKGPTMLWSTFHALIPNGAWMRQVSGRPPAGLVLPIEGALSLTQTDEDALDHNTGVVLDHSFLWMQSPMQVDRVRVFLRNAEFQVAGEWIDFRELCLRATEERLDEARSVASEHLLAWMTHERELNISLEQIGAMLYDAARWIEAQGNRGYSDTALQIGVPTLKIRLLSDVYSAAWKDIVFFGTGDTKHDFRGWGVHKRTPAHWSVTWLERYGIDSAAGQAHMEAVWDEAHAAHETRAVKRGAETYLGFELELMETRQVAHMAAALWLLSQWAQARVYAGMGVREMWRLQSRLYSEASDVFEHELVYRQDQQPKVRRGRKIKSVRKDWSTAADYFTTASTFFGSRRDFDVHHFYTQGYIKFCCASDAMPDTALDFDALPRDVRIDADTGEVQP